MLEPYYEQGGITIYHGDCREVMSELETVDAVVTDPPYGMRWNTNSARFSGGETERLGFRGRGKDWGPIAGDDEPFDPSPLLAYDRVVIFGANHFGSRLPVGTTLVWVKRKPAAFGTFLSDAEIAWMKGGYGVYCFEDVSGNGSGANFDKVHPTQKPLRVMSWCIEKCRVPHGGTVLDPYMGSGTTLRAAKDLGYRAIGINVREDYCQIAAKRLAQEVLPFTN